MNELKRAELDKLVDVRLKLRCANYDYQLTMNENQNAFQLTFFY